MHQTEKMATVLLRLAGFETEKVVQNTKYSKTVSGQKRMQQAFEQSRTKLEFQIQRTVNSQILRC